MAGWAVRVGRAGLTTRLRRTMIESAPIAILVLIICNVSSASVNRRTRSSRASAKVGEMKERSVLSQYGRSDAGLHQLATVVGIHIRPFVLDKILAEFSLMTTHSLAASQAVRPL